MSLCALMITKEPGLISVSTPWSGEKSSPEIPSWGLKTLFL